MKVCLLLLLYVFSPYSHGSEFNLSFYPDKAVVNYPIFKKKEDNLAILVFDNKLMSALFAQVIDDKGNIISNISVDANKTGSLQFKKNKLREYFVVPIQPAAEKIPLVYSGRQVEIP